MLVREVTFGYFAHFHCYKVPCLFDLCEPREGSVPLQFRPVKVKVGSASINKLWCSNLPCYVLLLRVSGL